MNNILVSGKSRFYKYFFYGINFFIESSKNLYFCPQGEMAEWSNAAVLKTVEGKTSGGSNPSLSAKLFPSGNRGVFLWPTLL